ncbi:hypothetical protein [Mucilaginibacter xinganensis]|uniref:Uncharacterized protein n=1 Tax=Mucilaginibacter xinganensis TaxID=1234841 RepID=A0A223NT05_9SPHI|nr:hypothetical protein [Mucilaginibacter xinganensis]ASU33035.1 hypothetical protein MuYL_1135 [Mucilaginibacter xinganensis]
MASKEPAITETALKQALEKKNLELVSYTRNDDGTMDVEANKLYPALTDDHGPLYVPLPVSLTISPNGEHDVKSIENDSPDKDAARDAKQFVKMLIDNKQLSGMPGEQQLHTTHKIDTNAKGQRVIRRQGFSGS